MRHALYIATLGLAVFAVAQSAAADDPPGPAEPPGLWERDTLTGDWGGARTQLSDWGVDFGAGYTGDVLANVSGGIRRGAVYAGQLKVSADIDLAKLASWEGASIHADAFQIHGRGLSAEFLRNLLATSNIEAHPATRLYTAWFQQNLFDDLLSIRAGQIAADDEFVVSNTATAFLNGTFAWLPLTASNLHSGGPGYPLATPGVRMSAMPAEEITILSAVFSGDPAGKPGAEDPQIHNASGTTFSLDGGALLMAEVQYAFNRGGQGLPGVYKVGGWYHTGKFDDLRTDNAGLSLANPVSSGVPARHRGNRGIYAVMDQTVYRESGAEDRGLNLFMRIGGAPADRNPIEFYVDGGLGYKGLIPGRAEDVLAIGGGFAEMSDDLKGLDNDSRLFSGASTPVRSHEAVLEFTYVGQIAPWWSVQPDVQLLFNPGGNIANPNDSSGLAVIPDAVVVGLRTVVAF